MCFVFLIRCFPLTGSLRDFPLSSGIIYINKQNLGLYLICLTLKQIDNKNLSFRFPAKMMEIIFYPFFLKRSHVFICLSWQITVIYSYIDFGTKIHDKILYEPTALAQMRSEYNCDNLPITSRKQHLLKKIITP